MFALVINAVCFLFVCHGICVGQVFIFLLDWYFLGVGGACRHYILVMFLSRTYSFMNDTTGYYSLVHLLDGAYYG